jgi:phosphatidylserine decarboxylase
MLAVEKNLLNGVINPKHVIPYIKNNERMWNKVYSPSLDYSYYMIQIADEDVDVIVPFTTDQNELFTQNSRFSLIRWGSQTDLVLPLDSRFDFELCLPEHMHVEAGIDKLVKISMRD